MTSVVMCYLKICVPALHMTTWVSFSLCNPVNTAKMPTLPCTWLYKELVFDQTSVRWSALNQLLGNWWIIRINKLQTLTDNTEPNYNHFQNPAVFRQLNIAFYKSVSKHHEPCKIKCKKSYIPVYFLFQDDFQCMFVSGIFIGYLLKQQLTLKSRHNSMLLYRTLILTVGMQVGSWFMNTNSATNYFVTICGKAVKLN